jgi:hypothetical protein
MTSAVVLDVTPRDSCKNRRFGGTYRLHHQGEKRILRNWLGWLVTDNVPRSLILFTLMMEAIDPLKRPFLQEPHSIISQTTAFFTTNEDSKSYAPVLLPLS